MFIHCNELKRYFGDPEMRKRIKALDIKIEIVDDVRYKRKRILFHVPDRETVFDWVLWKCAIVKGVWRDRYLTHHRLHLVGAVLARRESIKSEKEKDAQWNRCEFTSGPRFTSGTWWQ